MENVGIQTNNQPMKQPPKYRIILISFDGQRGQVEIWSFEEKNLTEAYRLKKVLIFLTDPV